LYILARGSNAEPEGIYEIRQKWVMSALFCNVLTNL